MQQYKLDQYRLDQYAVVDAAQVASLLLNNAQMSSKGTKFLVQDPPVEVVAKRQRFPAVPCAYCLRAHPKLIVRSVRGEQRDRTRFLHDLVQYTGIYLHAADEQSTALLAASIGAKPQPGNPDNYDFCGVNAADYRK